MKRRTFLKMTSTAVIVPRAVLGGPGNTPPSERINIAYIGCGTQGMRNLIDLLPRTDARVVAVCDPNTASNDYVEWGHNEIRDRIRSFLGDQSWGQNTQGCRCGRQVGLEIVHRHYANTSRPTDCTPYIDFRDLLQNHKDLDACYIMTPEHLHAAIAVASMKHGKHVVTHKPIANVMNEVRLAENTARQTGRATHLFCSAGLDSTPLIKEWITAGAIGSVRQVHNWSTRPFWPQGMYERPPQQPVPDGLNWDLWLGPVPHRPYNLTYTHAVFRGWCDFGSGALGDMGHYSSYQIFKILDLPAPVSVEASRSQYWAIENLTWQKKVNDLSYPRASRIHWRFPARQDQPPVDLYWYDGGILPDLPEELEVDNEPLPDEGLLFVGDRGKLLAGFSGGSPRLIPKKKMKDFTPPPQTLARPKPELDQWLTACKGGAPSDARFEITAKLSETVAIGNVALRVRGKLLWDSQNMKFTNNENANEYLRREYRPGWEL